MFSLLLYALLNRQHKTNSLMHPVARMLFILYATWVLLESANFNLPSVLLGIWGVKAHLLYASLILLLPMAYSNLNDLLRWIVRIYPWVVIPVCALAFVQLAAPAASFINLQLPGGLDTDYFGEASLVRISGTFSYIAGMAAFVQMTTVLGVGLFMGGARSRLFIVGLAFAFSALPTTGSRSVIVVACISTLMMLFAANEGPQNSIAMQNITIIKKQRGKVLIFIGHPF